MFDFNEIFFNATSSLLRVLCGVAFGGSLGIALGLARYYLPASLQKNFALNLLFDGPKYPPPIAWIPFVILGFGIGNISAVVIVTIAALPPLFTQVYDELRRLSPKVLLVAANMEIQGRMRLQKILIPAILPGVFTGLRTSLGMGWMAIIAAEMVSGQEGLGYALQLHRQNLDSTAMLLDLFLIGLIGFALQAGLKQFEKKWVRP